MIQVFIDNEEVVSNKEFTIHEELLNTSSTILNNCYPKSWETTKDYVSNFYFPKDYSNCEIYDNGTLIFNGIVKNSGEISLNPYDPKYCSLQILDYKCLLSEGQTLDYVIEEGTIGEQIDSVISKITDYGFVRGNIILDNINEQVGAYSTLDKTPYDVFQYFAEISGSRWFTRRIDTTHTAIDFYTPELMNIAPNIQYTKEYFDDKNIVNMEFSFSGADYRNKQIILSNQVFSSIDTIDTIIATAEQTKFITSEIVGKLNQVYVNGETKTIGDSADKELGIYADFYYKIGTNEIESSSAQSLGAEIKLIYTSLIEGRQVVSNEDEINRISSQISRNGTIARYETRNDTSSSKELSKIADTYLKFKGKAEIELTITTKDFDIFELGQQTYFEAPIEELQSEYLVKSKDIQITKTGSSGVIFYTYVLSNCFDVENAINFFDNQRRKNSGNIDKDKFITRNIDIDNKMNIIFESPVIEETNIMYDNELNARLNTPFNE